MTAEKIADLGLSVNDVARVIQTNIGGSRAGVFRDAGDEISHYCTPATRRPVEYNRS
ncbi:MAG: hypothetical protein U5K69_27385 [Balneolaceae bacterium]|nr:hypothetical protein [Balneolaceae bacterium]